MKLRNVKLNFSVRSNSVSLRRNNSINKSAKRASPLAALLALVFCLIPNAPAMAQTGLLTAGPSTPRATGGILINNFNNAGVQSGLAANMGTIFTLEPGATYNLTSIVTYQWGNGRGAPGGGTIDIENQYQQVIRTFNVSVQPASGNVPANWVVNINPPMQLGPGIYIVRSSSPSTQANNSQSSGCLWFNPSFQCGFVKIMGSATLPPPPPHSGGSGSAPAPYSPATQNICTSSPVPPGWLVINQMTEIANCPYGGLYLADNVETIEQYSTAPVGTTLWVCSAWAPTPPGWVVVNKTTEIANCPYFGQYLANNVTIIKRIT